MPSCATGDCAPDCAFCARLRRLFPPIVRCVGFTQDEQKPCGLVSGHPGPCRRGTRGHVAQPDLKDAAPLPDFSAPRAAAIALGRIKRHRVGPHR